MTLLCTKRLVETILYEYNLQLFIIIYVIYSHSYGCAIIRVASYEFIIQIAINLRSNYCFTFLSFKYYQIILFFLYVLHRQYL